MKDYFPLIIRVIIVAGTVLAAIIAANRGLENYREQKNADLPHGFLQGWSLERQRYGKAC
jgi:hypothetical protein